MHLEKEALEPGSVGGQEGGSQEVVGRSVLRCTGRTVSGIRVVLGPLESVFGSRREGGLCEVLGLPTQCHRVGGRKPRNAFPPVAKVKVLEVGLL